MRALVLSVLIFPAAYFICRSVPAQIGFEVHGISAFRFDGESAGFGDQQVKDGRGGGAAFFFALIPAVRLEVGADWMETRDRDLADSRLRLSPLTAALRAGYNLGGLYLYIGGGAGYALGELYPSREAEERYARIGVYDLGISNDPIYFALAGAELALSNRFGLRIEYRYNRLRSNLTYQDWRGFEEKEKLNLDHQQFRAGIAVYF